MGVSQGLSDIGRALVIGLGASGGAAVEALRAAGVDVVAVEAQPDAPAISTARAAGAAVHPGVEDPVAHLDDVDLVVPSPGVAEHAEVLVAAAAAGVPIWSEPELGWRLHPRRLVGVTGTNGKTSVTELVAAMLAAAGTDAVACGNIGVPLTTAAAGSARDAILVAELSSFQLRFCHRLRPDVGVLLNVAPDHLDWHDDLASYHAAKTRLWQAQDAGDWVVAGADDATARTLATAGAPGHLALVSGSHPPSAPGAGVVDGWLTVALPDEEPHRVLPTTELWPPAAHHRANVAAAAMAAMLVGAGPREVADAARQYRPGPHRLELIGEHRGVAFVDDSKATNPHAAAAGLRAFDSVVWIAGGRAKGVDLHTLADALDPVRSAVLIGEAAPALVRLCDDHGVPAVRAASMDEAVRRAVDVARRGDTVLLAPACASFDMFRDYAERGEAFAAAVRDGREHDG